MTLSIPDEAKVNAKHYVETLLPGLIEESKSLLASVFFQQDGAPAQTSKLAQDWIANNYSEFIGKVNGHQTRQTLTLLTITSGELYLNTTRHFIPSQRTLVD